MSWEKVAIKSICKGIYDGPHATPPLDEPTNGLDPAGIEEMRELIKTLPKQYGMTVMISSHILSEICLLYTSRCV